MQTVDAYNLWSGQYDQNINRTRDLEGAALRGTLNNLQVENALEIGCGTGKNSVWLANKASHLTAVDFSPGMLEIARKKVGLGNVEFIEKDILAPWNFHNRLFDLITFSLVLEHIENLSPIFEKASSVLNSNGHLYIGELHPFKQYAGSKARFDLDQSRHVLSCFTHHISEFIDAARENDLQLIDLKEYFDEDEKTDLPRVLVLLFKKVQIKAHNL